MGDGWSNTQGCDKQKKEDDKLRTAKGFTFYTFYNLVQVKGAFL